MDFAYRVSVIVPVYNQEQSLERCVACLRAQTMPKCDLEVLLVDDGSTDASSRMCDEYAERYDNFSAVHKENGSLSDARNCGIDHAHGRYLMHLYPYDTIEPETCQAVADFFDEHYDEIDLVTYPSRSFSPSGEVEEPHYRYQVLVATGIYDLADDANIYAGVTGIEVCVKNLGNRSVRFSPDRSFRRNELKYNIDVILDKLKIGFVNEGAYHHLPKSGNLSGADFQTHYPFESTMAFWEEEFGKYDEGVPVPRYLQALYVHDIVWKEDSDSVFPDYSQGDRYEVACNRIYALLARCDSDIIMRHPAIDQFQGAALLKRKPGCHARCLVGTSDVALVEDDELLFSSDEGIEIILLRTDLNEGELHLYGFLKSPCFLFCAEPPVLHAWAVADGVRCDEVVPLRPSSWNYYMNRAPICEFWDFDYRIHVDDIGWVELVVELMGKRVNTKYYMTERAIFTARDSDIRRRAVAKGDYLYSFDGYRRFHIHHSNPKELSWGRRNAERDFGDKPMTIISRRAAVAEIRSGRRIWLYHDCHGVEKNNAYYQYLHDIAKDDGVDRYYVVNDPLDSKRHLFTRAQMRKVIRFGGKRHKLLFLAAEKIVTAYVEQYNWIPFDEDAFVYFADLFRAQIVYLQHGVLHASTPWKYSKDRLRIDKEIVSTPFEAANLCENYTFDDADLIKAGMPRYDFINHDAKPKRKILVAMSWRSYLANKQHDGTWAGSPTFTSSTFYTQVNALLNSPRLAELLERYDYTLEFKLHPILAECYPSFFEFDNPRVSLAKSSVDDEDYAVFITDFSSYRFDYVYLKRAIMYFFPDKDLFDAGLSYYCALDLPLDGTFGDLAVTADEALDLLADILERGGKPKSEYATQMDGFFYYYDNNQCERIYQALISDE